MTEATTVFHPEQIGQWGRTVEFAVDRERTIEFARATNDPIAAHRDGTLAAPAFAVVPPFTIMADRAVSAVPDELILRILHGGHDIRLHRRIVPRDRLACRAKATGIHQRSSGVVVTTLAETRGADGQLVNEQYFAGFFPGSQFPGGSAGQSAPNHSLDPSLYERAPDALAVRPCVTSRHGKHSGSSAAMRP